MRNAGLSKFRKLYGHINQDIPAGKYKLVINNTYDVSSQSGSKFVILTNANAIGGQNYFLAVCYIVLGILSIAFGVFFFISYMRVKKQLARGAVI